MEEHFERFRDPQNTIRRAYSGAFNNRIDRFPAVGGSFRVEGVTKHALKTDCFISEDLRTTRALPFPHEIEEDNGGNHYCRNGFTYLTRCLYAYPDYPHFPRFSTRCVEPNYVSDLGGAPLVPFALNKTFDNVLWRTENSKNSLECNVYDTVELVPWLSHNECVTDVARNKTHNFQNLAWFDFNTNQELPTTPSQTVAFYCLTNDVSVLH